MDSIARNLHDEKTAILVKHTKKAYSYAIFSMLKEYTRKFGASYIVVSYMFFLHALFKLFSCLDDNFVFTMLEIYYCYTELHQTYSFEINAFVFYWFY